MFYCWRSWFRVYNYLNAILGVEYVYVNRNPLFPLDSLGNHNGSCHPEAFTVRFNFSNSYHACHLVQLLLLQSLLLLKHPYFFFTIFSTWHILSHLVGYCHRGRQTHFFRWRHDTTRQDTRSRYNVMARRVHHIEWNVAMKWKNKK